MREFIASLGELRVVAFSGISYAITYRTTVVSDRMLSNYLKMSKRELQEIAKKYNALTYVEDTREITYFKELTKAVDCMKELMDEKRYF